MNKTYAICYDTLYVFNNKEEAKKHFLFCYDCSEGAEHERYASILVDLNFSNTGKDNISKQCNQVSIKLDNETEGMLNVELNEFLSIDDTINYYENKINPILEVSKNYDVNFRRKIPFEDFGSDNYINMSSFSDYYKEILNKLKINVNEIYTNEVSDGKYTLLLNNEIICDVDAWDNLDSVVQNIEAIDKFYREKDNVIEK